MMMILIHIFGIINDDRGLYYPILIGVYLIIALQ